MSPLLEALTDSTTLALIVGVGVVYLLVYLIPLYELWTERPQPEDLSLILTPEVAELLVEIERRFQCSVVPEEGHGDHKARPHLEVVK